MQTLTIRAATRESAYALHEALSAFQAEVVEFEDGRCEVEVPLGSDRETVEVLNAIERYVNGRQSGPAQIAFNGREYTLHAQPSVSSSDS